MQSSNFSTLSLSVQFSWITHDSNNIRSVKKLLLKQFPKVRFWEVGLPEATLDKLDS